MKISVSILKRINNYKDAIDIVNNTTCDYLHLDITDSTFTPTTSFNLDEFQDITIYKPLDIHIMSSNLELQVNRAINLNPEYITIQYEASKEIDKYINLIKSKGIKVGLAINPKTRLWSIRKYLKQIDLLLIMSVKAGFGGQEFIPSVIRKLKRLKQKKKKFVVSIDGGINLDTYKLVKDYVDIVVIGSYITNSDNYEEQIKKIREI